MILFIYYFYIAIKQTYLSVEHLLVKMLSYRWKNHYTIEDP